MMVAKKVLLQFLKSSIRCPLCGGISRKPYSTGRLSGVRLEIPDRRIAGYYFIIYSGSAVLDSGLISIASLGPWASTKVESHETFRESLKVSQPIFFFAILNTKKLSKTMN